MASPAVKPAATLPADFDGWDKTTPAPAAAASSGPPATLPADFNFDTPPTAAAASVPATDGATLFPAATPTWLQQVESDLTTGGRRTALGRILGALQGGNNGAGYSGIGGVSPAAARFMASPALGLIHGAQGAQETVSGHPVSGIAHSIMGGLEAATIPSLVVGGPGAAEVAEAVPSAKHAGEMFSQIAKEAGSVPVQPQAMTDALLRVHELAARGSTLPKVAKQLLTRATDQAPILYNEARDFATNISRMSVKESMDLNPPMKAAIGNLREGLHADIRTAADTVGRGEDYVNALREYARAHTLSDTLQKVGKWAAGAAGAGSALGAYEHFRR